MTEAEIADLRAEIRRHVLLVHDAEEEAVLALKSRYGLMPSRLSFERAADELPVLL